MGIFKINIPANRVQNSDNQLYEIIIQSEHLRRTRAGLSIINRVVSDRNLLRTNENHYVVLDDQYQERVIFDITLLNRHVLLDYYYCDAENTAQNQQCCRYILAVSDETREHLLNIPVLDRV